MSAGATDDDRLGHDAPGGGGLGALIRLVETLRGEKGCPWDRQQTLQSIVGYLVEEVYELAEAVAVGTADQVEEELGDVLFHVFFMAHLLEQAGTSDLTTVAESITAKMIRRHPHVFGDTHVADAQAVKAQWQAIKSSENHQRRASSVLDSIPQTMPALMRAYRVSQRAAAAGFDWRTIVEVMAKVEEEWAEMKHELTSGTPTGERGRRLALEFGDVLFTMTNVARFADFHPEQALADSTRKFEKRFRLMEQMLTAADQTLETIARDQREQFWEKAKAALRTDAAPPSPV